MRPIRWPIPIDGLGIGPRPCLVRTRRWADELERAAARAAARGGVAAVAAFLRRATELTPDPQRRGPRALAAAQAKLDAASPDEAADLLETAAMDPLDELQEATLVR
jgi:hypothetical protein